MAADANLPQNHSTGTCCDGDPTYNVIGVMTYAGWTATPECKRAFSDYEPRAACGCTCIGTWYKTMSYRVQYQTARDQPFVNLPGATRLLATSVSATGLTTGIEYGFRVFAQGLNGQGADMSGSNIVYARPLDVPAMPVAATLVSTYRAGESALVGTATITWQHIGLSSRSTCLWVHTE